MAKIQSWTDGAGGTSASVIKDRITQAVETVETDGTYIEGDGNVGTEITPTAGTIASLGKADTALQSVVAGTNVTVDDTDPQNPIISASGGGGGAVDSVNGETGVVVLDADDISDAATTNKYTNAADIARLENTSGTNTGDQDLSG